MGLQKLYLNSSFCEPYKRFLCAVWLNKECVYHQKKQKNNESIANNASIFSLLCLNAARQGLQCEYNHFLFQSFHVPRWSFCKSQKKFKVSPCSFLRNKFIEILPFQRYKIWWNTKNTMKSARKWRAFS